jgi:hypothetical protein
MYFTDIEVDALKRYLVTELSQICDADPVVFTDYIIALLRHKKPISDLKRECNEQLVDFLGPSSNSKLIETRPFVDLLFNLTNTKNYMKTHVNEKRARYSPEDRRDKDVGRNRDYYDRASSYQTNSTLHDYPKQRNYSPIQRDQREHPRERSKSHDRDGYRDQYNRELGFKPGFGRDQRENSPRERSRSHDRDGYRDQYNRELGFKPGFGRDQRENSPRERGRSHDRVGYRDQYNRELGFKPGFGRDQYKADFRDLGFKQDPYRDARDQGYKHTDQYRDKREYNQGFQNRPLRIKGRCFDYDGI